MGQRRRGSSECRPYKGSSVERAKGGAPNTSGFGSGQVFPPQNEITNTHATVFCENENEIVYANYLESLLEHQSLRQVCSSSPSVLTIKSRVFIRAQTASLSCPVSFSSPIHGSLLPLSLITLTGCDCLVQGPYHRAFAPQCASLSSKAAPCPSPRGKFILLLFGSAQQCHLHKACSILMCP